MALLRLQEAAPIQSVRLSLVLVIFVAALSAAMPSASAGGCVNAVHTADPDQAALSADPSPTGVGVIVRADGTVIGLIVVPDDCHVPDLVGRFATQALAGVPSGLPPLLP